MKFSTVVALSCALVVAAAAGAAASTSYPGGPGQTSGQPFCCVKQTCTYYGYRRECTNTCTQGWTGSGREPDGIRGSDVAQCTKATAGYWTRSIGSVCVDDKCISYVPGAVQDPHVGGLDGRQYTLWGKHATTYNLLSERTHAINIRLYRPETMKDGHALYIDAVGILIRSARIAIKLVNPGEHVNGKPAPPPASLELSVNDGPGLTFPGHPVDRAVDAYTSYSMRNANKITITSRDIVLSVVLRENFYLDVLVDEVAAHWSNVHGIMGQTHANAFKLRYNYARGTAVGELPGDAMKQGKGRAYTIKGEEDDYIVSDLLKADDKFSRFEPSAAEEAGVQSKTRKLAGVSQAVAVVAAGVRERTNAGVFGN